MEGNFKRAMIRCEACGKPIIRISVSGLNICLDCEEIGILNVGRNEYFDE